MAQMHAISLTALALVLGGGLPLSASAQQTYGAPPAYDAPPTRYQEPPPLGVPPRDQEQPPGHVQLYSEPGKAAELPATSAPRPYPYTEPPPERMTDYPGDSGPGYSPSGSFLQVRDDRGIRYVSGGIGLGEREELRALSPQFNLRLMFAMHGSGNYLADVQVRILDSRGAAVLNATAQGPYFLTQLPPGRYTVEVSTLDQTQRQTARVDARQTQLNFYWR